MADPPSFFLSRLLFFSFLQLSIFLNFSSAFSPVDNYLVDCGSTAQTTVDNRHFIGDSSKSGEVYLSAGRTISLTDQNPSVGSSPLYHTARVFRKPSTYEFEIKQRGTHLVRLHFLPFSSSNYNLSDARFHVSVHEFLLLRDFGCHDNSPVLKEYFIWVDSSQLVISFIPSKEAPLAFVNAIEVISAPGDLIADTARLVNCEGVDNFDGLTKQAMETVYRVNVGGPKVTPFNDSFWRTWIPDDSFLRLSAASKSIYSSGRIKYQPGGASREVAPDSVYNTARVMGDANVSSPNFNITWDFPVSVGYKYLVRMHFCDIYSISLYLLYFDVYVNGHLAYKDLDLSSLTGMLASPYFADFVVDADASGVVTISIGPSNLSSPSTTNAILNGVEIMKMNNSAGSLDGDFSVGSVLQSWPRRKVGVLVPCVAAMSLLITAFLVMYRRMTELQDSVAWSPLPVDVQEGKLNGKR